MKKTLLILSIITIFFAGCKKDVEPVASKLEMTNETIERGWDYVKITAEYEYPVELKSIVLYLSENEDMSGARTYRCKIEGKTFSVEVDGLEEGRDYYCYFEFDDGYKKVKGEKYDVMTISKPIIVVTKDVTNKTTTSATLNGSVTNDADNKIVARGFCWSMEPNVTIEDESINNGGSSGAGTSTFSHNLTNLKDNTTYYYKAYATTELGVCYGEEKSFKTEEIVDISVDSDGNEIVTLYGNIVFKMISVEGGTFSMGATSEQGGDADSDEKPVHSVTLSDYYIGETEVTQELWQAVMGNNPSYFSGSQKPVEQVSWNDCQEFITKLNQLTGKNFRLPTEAEWEYAARGGNKSQGYKYSGSNTIGNVAWYTDNSSSTHDVKTKSPNELGIYDMSGNVWEWCQDWNGSYSSGSQTNPTGPSFGSYRVLRGGGWFSGAWYCRVSNRDYNDPVNRYDSFGFRLAL